MRAATLYIAAAICLVLIVSMAWWTREFIPLPPDPSAVETTVRYEVQAGDSAEAIAEGFKIDLGELTAANPSSMAGDAPLQPGETLVIPMPDAGLLSTWGVHGLGLLAELVGVLLSFWLAAMTGILPKTVRRQVFGIAAVLAIVSYAASQSVAAENPLVTPQFVFGALKDGFMWSAAFPMLARLLGIKDAEAIQLRA